MSAQLFLIDNFLREGEVFHFARKKLSATPPAALHRHDFYELLLTDGDVLHLRPDRTDKLKAGDLVFIRPDDAHALQAPRGHSCEIANVAFSGAVIEDLLGRYPCELRNRFFWSDRSAPEVYGLPEGDLRFVLAAFKDLQLGNNAMLALDHFLMSIFKRLNLRLNVVSSESQSDMPNWLQSACAAVQSPDVFSQGASGFVAAAGRGHEHVCRVARKHLGVSPTEYVNKLRMDHAASLLGGSDMSIMQISVQCGIENLSHFYRIFRTHHGMTPKLYRKRFWRDPERLN